MAKLQLKVVFSGDVQGVGFRYTACRIAADYDVTGYVRNLPDGRVECVVEGQREQIDSFVDAVATAMGVHIARQTQQASPYGGIFDAFGVRY